MRGAKRDLLHLGLDGDVLLAADGEPSDHLRERGAERSDVGDDRSAAGHRCRRRDGGDEPGERLAARGGLSHLPFEHQIGCVRAPAQVARGGLEQGALGDEADDLAPGGRHTQRLGLQPHHLVRAVQRGDVEVHEVHRDLRLAVDLHAEALHALEAAGGPTHRLGDALGDGEVLLAAEVDVESDEEGARADHRGAGSRMDRVRAEVGDAVGIGADLLLRLLELAASDVGEIHAVGARGRAFVEEDGDAEFLADACAEGAGEDDAVLHRRAFERDEGADVGGADARVFAGVVVQVDQLGGLGDPRERRAGRARDRRGEGDHGAVVRRVAGDVEDDGALDRGDRVTDGRNDFGAAAFGEVRDAFDEGHMDGRREVGVRESSFDRDAGTAVRPRAEPASASRASPSHQRAQAPRRPHADARP